MSQPLAKAPEVEDHRIGTLLAEFQVTSQGTALAAPETLAQKVRVELLPALEDVFAHPDVLGRDAVINALEIDLGDWPDDPDWAAVRLCFRERMLSALAPYLRTVPLPQRDEGRAVAPGGRVGPDLAGRVPLQAQPNAPIRSINDSDVAETVPVSATEQVAHALWASSGQTAASVLTAARKRNPSAFDALLRSRPDSSHHAFLAATGGDGTAVATPGVRAMEQAFLGVFARAGHSAQAARGFAAQMVAQLLVRPVGPALLQASPSQPPDSVASRAADQKDGNGAPVGGTQSPARASDVQTYSAAAPTSSHRQQDRAVLAGSAADTASMLGTPNVLNADWARDPEHTLQRFRSLDVAALLSLVQSLLPTAKDDLSTALVALADRSARPEAALILVLRAVLDGRPIDLDEIERAAAGSQIDERADDVVSPKGASGHRETQAIWRDVVLLLTRAATGAQHSASDGLPDTSDRAAASDHEHTEAIGSDPRVAPPETQPATTENEHEAGRLSPEMGTTQRATAPRTDPGSLASTPLIASAGDDENEKPARPLLSSDHAGASQTVSSSRSTSSDETTPAAAQPPSGPQDDEGSRDTAGSDGPSLPDLDSLPSDGDAGHPPARTASGGDQPQGHAQPDTKDMPPALRLGISVPKRIDLPKVADLLAEAAFGAASEDLRQMLTLTWAVLDAQTQADVARRFPSPLALPEPSGPEAGSTQLPPAVLLDLIARTGPGQRPLDAVLTHLLDILMPQADDQRRLLRLMISRLSYVDASLGPPALRDRLRAGFESVFATRSRAPTSTEPAARQAAEDPARRLLTQQAGLVLFHPFLKLLFSRLDLLGPKDKIAPDHLPRARTVLDALCGIAPSERRDDPLARLLLGMTDEMPPPAPTDISDEASELVEGLLRSVISQWSKLGQTSPKGLQEAFVRRTGQIRFDAAGAHLRVDPGPFDILLDGLPWTLDTTVALPWMNVPCHVSWRAQDG